jgi:hypothetical protein
MKSLLAGGFSRSAGSILRTGKELGDRQRTAARLRRMAEINSIDNAATPWDRR